MANGKSKKKYKRVMLDAETLGLKPGCVVLSISAVFFDLDDAGAGIEDKDKFFIHLPLFESLAKGLTIDPDTANWWTKQKEAVRNKTHESLLTLAPLYEQLSEFRNFLVTHRKEEGLELEVWANSPSFDVEILLHLFKLVNLPWPAKYYNEMDSRTIRRFFDIEDDELSGLDSSKRHDPEYDCEYQIKVVQLARSRVLKVNFDLDKTEDLVGECADSKSSQEVGIPYSLVTHTTEEGAGDTTWALHGGPNTTTGIDQSFVVASPEVSCTSTTEVTSCTSDTINVAAPASKVAAKPKKKGK